MKSKTAQMGTLQTIIITLVVIGIVLGIGFLVLEEFTKVVDERVTRVNNETVQFDSEVFAPYVTKNYTTPNIDCYNSFVILDVSNATSGDIIEAGNYSYDSDGKVWNVTGDPLYILALWNVSYTYKHGVDSCAGVKSTIEATKKIPTWLSIIVILMIVGILLAIVFRVLPTAGGGWSFGRGAGGTTAEI